MNEEHWSRQVPEKIQREIGDAVRQQAINLPVSLFAEWFSPVHLEKSWFQQASKYIEIPYPEYWNDSASS